MENVFAIGIHPYIKEITILPLLIPARINQTEFTEKKSRFISRACHVQDSEEARAIVKEIKQEFPDARHVVWAFICGKDRSVFGYSDDGEPHGTAGRPLFEVLKGSPFTDTLVTVTRYFGGIKLGTGGLVSAYTRAGQDVLAGLPFNELVDRTAGDIFILLIIRRRRWGRSTVY